MSIYQFSESQKIATKNRDRQCGERKPERSLLDFQKKPPPGQVATESKPTVKMHDLCRDCGQVLENKASKIWGICPSCDMR